MGLLDFFKGIRKTKSEFYELSFEELPLWLTKREGEIDNKKEEIKELIKEFVTELISNLKKSVLLSEKINIDEKKADLRVKFIVKENFKNYVYLTSKLILSLEDVSIEYKKIEETINTINKIIFNFEKKSSLSYEKATYLIGEMGIFKRNMEDFYSKIKNIDMKTIQHSKSFEKIKGMIEEISKNEQISEGFDEAVKDNHRKIKKISEESKRLIREIEEINKSKEYIQELNEKDLLEEEKSKNEKEIYTLKSMVDFKLLSGIYHNNPKEMNIIKQHQSSFLKSFKGDNGESLLKIIEDINKSSINKTRIQEKIREIDLTSRRIKEKENSLNLKLFAEIVIKESELSKKNESEYEINQSIIKENKLNERIKSTIKEIKENIKEELLNHNIRLTSAES